MMMMMMMRNYKIIPSLSFHSQQCRKLPFHPLSQSFSRTSSTTITFQSALHILKLHHRPNYNPKELRDAYFAAAKLCHPDTKKKQKNSSSSSGGKRFNDDDDDDMTIKFLELTEAYEILQEQYKKSLSSNSFYSKTQHTKQPDSSSSSSSSSTYIIHQTEEENFRSACREKLGLDAETVEESKQCPLFREWLKGKTDAAFHWNMFFMMHGGLAPMLNQKKVMRLSEGDDSDGLSGRVRRRRRK